jgi:hypothetical protein
MSEIVAEARLTPGLANIPAKNLQMVRPARLRDRPDPRVKSAKVGVVRRYTVFRPKVSLNGDEMTGPNAMPRL